MCFAAQWEGQKGKPMFYSEWQHGHKEMIEALHSLLSEADAVCGYNINRFDLPVANREFLLYGLEPPDPYHNIDLYREVKKNFRFASNKLDHVCQELKLGKKVEHEGFTLWVNCMNGDTKAQKKMQTYCMGDVELLPKLYKELLPWIKNHPNWGLYSDTARPVCPNCGSEHVIKKGIETTQTCMYQRYKCSKCGTPIRGRTNLTTKEKRGSLLTQSKL
jgi:DNA polymerase elongation subunit (family B)/predicted RNA-binding Zn-ribbon protein involved in translation (DUF1610 family)